MGRPVVVWPTATSYGESILARPTGGAAFWRSEAIGKLLNWSAIIVYMKAAYRYDRARSSRFLSVPAESKAESFLMARSAIQRARPTKGKAASVNSFVG